MLLFRIGTQDQVEKLLEIFITANESEVKAIDLCHMLIRKLENVDNLMRKSLFFKNYSVSCFSVHFTQPALSRARPGSRIQI